MLLRGSVVELDSPTQVRFGVIYISPLQCMLSIDMGIVHIEKSAGNKRPVNPIDHFCHAIAEDQGERGVHR